ncbi:MAG: zinc ribbon domain-containing protein [Ruminococcaceae bacterium]|nr:zinc ribbon domain-containing protein [Oscillospiraceae bacterium]
MFCPNCNTSVPDGTAFCPTCGVMLTQQPSQQPPQQPYGAYDPNQPNPYGMPYQPPMKWYKFLIYFSLFASGVLNILSGIGVFTAMFSDPDTIRLYDQYAIVQLVDIVNGLISIAVGVLAFYTRSCLAKYRANGPKLLTILYAITAASYLLVVLGILAVVPSANISSHVTSIASSVAFIFINRAYFKKRAHLFIY